MDNVYQVTPDEQRAPRIRQKRIRILRENGVPGVRVRHLWRNKWTDSYLLFSHGWGHLETQLPLLNVRVSYQMRFT